MLSKTTKKTEENPTLKTIRNSVSSGPRLEYNVGDLIKKTRNIHAGWLFDYTYKNILQKLCRLLDGNYDTCNTPGWGSFGNGLGLKSEVLNVIQYDKLGNEGYTYYVLVHYVQKEDATIDKIIDTLYSIKRYDVLNEIHRLISKLSENIRIQFGHDENVNPIQESEMDSGFCSVSSDDQNPIRRGPQNYQNQDITETRILRPKFIPSPPLVLQNDLEAHIPLFDTSHRVTEIEQENIQTSDISRTRIHNNETLNTSNKRTQKMAGQKYDCIVMLTFANDGITHAKNIATKLRAEREDGYNIGVLILEEHRDIVESNPEEFITGGFPQVNFIVPVITEMYLKTIKEINLSPNSEYSYIDCKYVRLIYTLMLKNFARNGCLNRKVRCILPDEMLHLNTKSAMRDPIFDNWVKFSSTDKLATRMLNRCIRKKYN